MNVLFLSHCVPNPPDKGERIRSFRELQYLAGRHQVHLVAFARSEREASAAAEIGRCCTSVYVERLNRRAALLRGLTGLACGGCLNERYYASARMLGHVRELSGAVPLDCAFVYSVVMAPYAPPSLPIVLDMVDVDSEKWLQYARFRRPRFLYAAEGRRLRALEGLWSRSARLTVLTTAAERAVLYSFEPGCHAIHVENGVDGGYFAPERCEQLKRQCIAFTGSFDYRPNIEGARWFATTVFPRLRGLNPALEFAIVGRNPAPSVRRLAREPGVFVTGEVPDVRPFLAGARAIVAPLDIARGIQNKVLEPLAMGRRVFASGAVCRTFEPDLPLGVVRCETADDFVAALALECLKPPEFDPRIRHDTLTRFSWESNLRRLATQMDAVVHPREQAAAS